MSEVVNDRDQRRSRTLKSGFNVIVGCVLLLVVLVGIYWLAGNSRQRVDLTHNQLYTLSDSTREILGGLDDRVTVNVYATEEGTPPEWNQRHDQLREMLVEYRTVSNGKVQFTFHNASPGSGSDAEKAAENAGMQVSLMQQASVNGLKLNKGYFGMVAEYKGKSEKIPFLNGPLEYQLTRVINKVAAVSTPEIGFLAPAGNPLMGQASQYSVLQNELENEGFKVTALQPTELHDLAHFKLLMLLEPQNLSDEALYNIDQYVMRGGKLFVAAPGVQLNSRGGMDSVTPNPPNINSILEYYGIRVSPNIVEDWKNGRSQATLTRSGAIVQYRDPFVFTTAERNDKSPLTSKIPMTLFAYTSTVDNSDRGTSGTITRLLMSSDVSRVQTGPFTLEPTELKPPAENEKLDQQSLAMMVSGTLNSRYATEPPPVLTNDDGTTYTPTANDIVKVSNEDARVVVVGSALLLVNQVIQQMPVNVLLPLNVAESFTRGSGALELRARQFTSSQLRKVSPAEASWTQVLIIGGIPVLLVIFGFIKMALNRRRRNRYQRIYGSPEV